MKNITNFCAFSMLFFLVSRIALIGFYEGAIRHWFYFFSLSLFFFAILYNKKLPSSLFVLISFVTVSITLYNSWFDLSHFFINFSWYSFSDVVYHILWIFELVLFVLFVCYVLLEKINKKIEIDFKIIFYIAASVYFCRFVWDLYYFYSGFMSWYYTEIAFYYRSLLSISSEAIFSGFEHKSDLVNVWNSFVSRGIWKLSNLVILMFFVTYIIKSNETMQKKSS